MHLFESLQLFGFGLLGIVLIAFIKMNDINKNSADHTFGTVFTQFVKTEWPSYGLSLTVILITCLTHDEWTALFKSGHLPAGVEFYDYIGGYVKLSMVAWGAVGQYLIYKWLGKMGK